MKDLILVPYIQINGVWTIPDEVMRGLYGLMVKEGTAKVVFYSGTVKNQDEFLSACKSSGTHTVFVLEETGEPIAIGWLNNFMAQTANAHWLTFKSAWGTGKTDQAIQKTLNYWFHFTKNGESLFEVLLGIYPEENEHIDLFARQAGFTVIGIIPALLYNYWEGRRVGAVISYIERRTVCHS